MSKTPEGCLPFPTPVFLFGTASFCRRFPLLAMICPPFHHLADIYVVLLQLLLHFLHCLFVRVASSKRNMNKRCKQIIGV